MKIEFDKIVWKIYRIRILAIISCAKIAHNRPKIGHFRADGPPYGVTGKFLFTCIRIRNLHNVKRSFHKFLKLTLFEIPLHFEFHPALFARLLFQFTNWDAADRTHGRPCSHPSKKPFLNMESRQRTWPNWDRNRLYNSFHNVNMNFHNLME